MIEPLTVTEEKTDDGRVPNARLTCEHCKAVSLIYQRPGSRPKRFCDSECRRRWGKLRAPEYAFAAPPRRQKLSLGEYDLIRRFCAEGFSFAEVGDLFGIDRKHAARIARGITSGAQEESA